MALLHTRAIYMQACTQTLAELYVCVLRSFIEFIMLLQKFIKLLSNHILV